MPGSLVHKTYFVLMVVEMDRALHFYMENSTRRLSCILRTGASCWSTGPQWRSIRALGGRIAVPPRDRPGEGIRIAQLADAEGNVLTVAEPAR
ncbi:VOC family protein [Microlunatus ginsengisoli]